MSVPTPHAHGGFVNIGCTCSAHWLYPSGPLVWQRDRCPIHSPLRYNSTDGGGPVKRA